VVRALSDRPVPATADLYCLGGGEDGPQTQAANALAAEGALARALAGGAAVLAVCAGFQIVGEAFAGTAGALHPGAGLLDVRSHKGTGPRAVGELLVKAGPAVGLASGAELLTGYENHGGVTERGPGVAPLGRVMAGVGNGVGDRGEGAVAGRVVGTYLHGPVLARNPALADHLLSLVVGDLDPLEDPEVEDLRAERLGAVHAQGHDRRWGRPQGGWRPRRALARGRGHH
ncbi:MAG TPA: hypothetical protein VE152_08145, partial [Acidimicrobiales bacterium]|nr:hypothetical protein [Acidimicrobiales bacterium]